MRREVHGFTEHRLGATLDPPLLLHFFPNMLLPKGGVNWKAARARLPPSRAIWAFVTRTRFLLFVAVAGIVLLAWNGLSGTAGEMQRYACPSFGVFTFLGRGEVELGPSKGREWKRV